MRLIFTYLIVVSAAFILSSCNNEKVDENQILRDDVIAIHDEVMPFMGELKTLSKKINEKSTDLLNQDSTGNHEQVLKLRRFAKALDDSFEGMFVWMRQFKSNYDDMTDQEIKLYLQGQKILVEKVRDDINSSVSVSKEALKDL